MDKTPEQMNEIITDFADSILRSLGFEHEIATVKCDAEEISLMISGPDSRFIIGDGGSRLDDLQYLLNRVAVMHAPNAPRVRVDCDHYRDQLEQRVIASAQQKAQQVLSTGIPQTLRPLNAYFRRLVHSALAEIPGIVTKSEESDARYKRITISRDEA